MGNRAVITTRDGWYNQDISLGVYLHWNGGRDSVEAFLTYCKLKGYRSPDQDGYGWARFCQVVGNFFGGSNSVGISTVSNLDCDNWDNGVYIIKGWEIIDRKYFDGEEQQEYDLQEMLIEIDKCMPEREQLGDYLKAVEVDTMTLEVGDKVYLRSYRGEVELCEVVGIGEDKVVNGHNVLGVPYVARYGYDGDYSKNPNNYLFEPTVRVCID